MNEFVCVQFLPVANSFPPYFHTNNRISCRKQGDVVTTTFNIAIKCFVGWVYSLKKDMQFVYSGLLSLIRFNHLAPLGVLVRIDHVWRSMVQTSLLGFLVSWEPPNVFERSFFENLLFHSSSYVYSQHFLLPWILARLNLDAWRHCRTSSCHTPQIRRSKLPSASSVWCRADSQINGPQSPSHPR